MRWQLLFSASFKSTFSPPPFFWALQHCGLVSVTSQEMPLRCVPSLLAGSASQAASHIASHPASNAACQSASNAASHPASNAASHPASNTACQFASHPASNSASHPASNAACQSAPHTASKAAFQRASDAAITLPLMLPLSHVTAVCLPAPSQLPPSLLPARPPPALHSSLSQHNVSSL